MTGFTLATYEAVLLDRVTGLPVPGCRLDADSQVAQFVREPEAVTRAFIQMNIPPFYDCGRCGSRRCGCEPNGRATELAFYRDDLDEPAWIGPVVAVGSSDATGQYEITAYDRMYWVQGAVTSRPIIGDYTPDELFGLLVRDADRYQDSGLVMHDPPANPDGLVLSVDIGSGVPIWGEIGKLSTVLSWSVVGPHLYWGAPSIGFECGPKLSSSKSWLSGGVTVEKSWSAAATRVRASGTGGIISFYPVDGDAEPVDGQGFYTLDVIDANLDTQEEVDEFARSTFETNRAAATFVTSASSTLGPNVDIGLNQLIPGRCFDINKDTGCLQADDTKALTKVIVDMDTKTSARLRELNVAADFAPLSTEARATG